MSVRQDPYNDQRTGHLDTSLDVGAEPLETLVQTVSTGRTGSLGQSYQHTEQLCLGEKKRAPG